MREKNCPVTNTTASPIYVGADMIPAGETRLFYEDDVPLHLRPVAAAPALEVPRDDIHELVANTPGRDVIAVIPGLSDDELERLDKLEQGRMVKDQKAARKTVLEAIAKEQLVRGEIAHSLALEEAAIVKGLPDLEAQLLPLMRAAEAAGQNRESLLAAIDAEEKRRAG